MLDAIHPMINSLSFYPRFALLFASMAMSAVSPDAHASIQATPIAAAVKGTTLSMPVVKDTAITAPVKDTIRTAPAIDDTALTAPVEHPVAAVPVPSISLQLSPKDGLLSRALAAFASKHGWTVSWELDRDFPIDFPARFDGSFLKIIEQVAIALQSSETPIRVKAYHGNHVLRVLAATQ